MNRNRPKKRLRQCAGCHVMSTRLKRANWTCPACGDVEIAASLIKRDGPKTTTVAQFDTSRGDIVREMPPFNPGTKGHP